MANKIYKYEMHLHTKEFGWCASVYAKDIVDVYYNAGYDGICVTNHYFKEGMNLIKGDLWEDKIDEWLDGYNKAKAHARQYEGFNVILGAELKLEEGNEDFLLYGVTKDILVQNPEVFNLTLKEFYKFAKSNGILIFQAHPFRKWLNLRDVNYLDGIEVYNGNPRHDSMNSKAYEVANRNNLIMIAGSDYHEIGDEATAAMKFSYPIYDSVEMANALRNRDGQVYIADSNVKL